MREKLTRFLGSIDDDVIARRISERADIGPAEAKEQFVKYKNEAFFALRVTEPYLDKSKTMLEVGSGIGIFSGFLNAQGYRITALEPVGRGYDFMRVAFEALREVVPAAGFPYLPIGAEDLDPAVHGKFDFIFSLHVLEHLPDLRSGLDAMDRVLADGGQIVHACPNYAFPYDPHFGILLLPFFPSATRHILPARIKRSGKWESINFITARQLKGLLRGKNYKLAFQPGVMAEMLQRVSTDAEFRKRHGAGFIGWMAAVANTSGVKSVLGRLPATLMSPMIVSMQRKN